MKCKLDSSREFVEWIEQSARCAATKRLIWVPYVEERERVGGHTYILLMAMWYMHIRYVPHLNFERMAKLCLVHDCPEYLDGDTPAYAGRFGEFNHLNGRHDKKKREAKAIKHLTRIWKQRFKDFIDYLFLYEGQKSEEAELVSSLDKLIANVLVMLDGGYTDKRLGFTVEEKDAYKRPRITHPAVLQLYDEIFVYVLSRPDLQFREGDPMAPERDIYFNTRYKICKKRAVTS